MKQVFIFFSYLVLFPLTARSQYIFSKFILYGGIDINFIGNSGNNKLSISSGAISTGGAEYYPSAYPRLAMNLGLIKERNSFELSYQQISNFTDYAYDLTVDGFYIPNARSVTYSTSYDYISLKYYRDISSSKKKWFWQVGAGLGWVTKFDTIDTRVFTDEYDRTYTVDNKNATYRITSMQQIPIKNSIALEADLRLSRNLGNHFLLGFFGKYIYSPGYFRSEDLKIVRTDIKGEPIRTAKILSNCTSFGIGASIQYNF